MSARSRKSKVAEVEVVDGANVSLTSSSVFERSRISQVGTPQRSFSRSERSHSPLSISRNDEKDELAHLNDRLAGYIDYVRKLELDKEHLTRRIHAVTEERMGKIEDARKTYEDEITDLRKLIDELANQKTKSELEAKQAKDDASDARMKLSKRDQEARALNRRIEALEKELSSYKDSHDRYPERDKFVEQKLYVEEEIEDRKKAEYESKLADELRAIREQTARELDEYKIQIEETFETKLNQLRSSADHSDADASRHRSELYTSRKKIDELTHDLEKKLAEVDLLNRRISDLEKQLEQERKEHEIQSDYHRQEVRRLKDQLEESFREFTELMNTKIVLDQEILMYRKMLEGEESRLKIQPSERVDSPFNIRAGKRRYGDGDSDDVELTGQPAKARFAYRVSSSASGPIEFYKEQDTHGKWIKLFNPTTDDAHVGGWELVHAAGGHETRFKFHHSLIIKPGTTCTIWSKDSDTTHNPPTDIVMKNKAFHAGSETSIELRDSDGTEKAKCTVKRERIKASTVNFGRRSTRGNSTDEKCMVM